MDNITIKNPQNTSVILSEAKDLLRGARSFVVTLLRTTDNGGFTLIELSIVLVIIGLIVGGVFTGRDLIAAAEVRAQVTQIEKYNSAVNTFHGKFNAIPGDMALTTAQQFGFNITSCDGTASRRDGNGLIDGYAVPAALGQGQGETLLFWEDLSSALAGRLIEGSFPAAGAPALGCYVASLSLVSTTLGNYYPTGKIGHGTFIYAYETSGSNWFGLSAVTSVNGQMFSSANLSVAQAYKIDAKIDDGLPASGNVQATYINNFTYATVNAPNATTDTATTCYNSSTGNYSVTYNNGSGGNCAVSFRFQ